MLKSIIVVFLSVLGSFIYQYFSKEPSYIVAATMAYWSYLNLLLLWLTGCIKPRNT